MIKRFLHTLIGLFLLGCVYMLTLVPLLVVRPHLDHSTFFRALIAWGVLALLSLPPALSALIRRVWLFPGTGTPVPEEELRRILLSVNDGSSPVRIRKKRRQLVAQWRFDDPEWCERMAAENVNRLYELYLKFDANTHTILVTDRYRRVNFSLCPIRIKTGLLTRPGLVFNIRANRDISMDEFGSRLPVDYSFRPVELKAPVTGTILKNGWNIQLSLL